MGEPSPRFTGAIDPTIEASDAPELASVISSSEVSPLDGIASRALFDDISQISKELTELEITTIDQSLSLSEGTLGPFEIPKTEVAHELAQPVKVSGFNLESETRVEFTVPNLPVAPLAAVRLASASVGISPVDGEFDSHIRSPRYVGYDMNIASKRCKVNVRKYVVKDRSAIASLAGAFIASCKYYHIQCIW